LSPYLDGHEIELPGALPLGVNGGGQYEATNAQLKPGSRLTFLSDGVVEAQNERGELFGFDQATAISREAASTIAEAAVQFGQADDITVVTIERCGKSSSE
jgi:serine phosphatase RsbU (regulator of sigma subunit)